MTHDRYAVFLLLLFCFLFPQPSEAKKYTQAHGVYTLDFPDAWHSKSDTSSGMFLVAPSNGNEDAVCITRAESSPTSMGGHAEDIIQRLVEKNIMVEAIKAANPAAIILETSKYRITNSVAQKILYTDKGIKTSMILAYNTATGHTVDVTCSAPEKSWDIHKQAFQAIQTSLTLLTEQNSSLQDSTASGPDFVGDSDIAHNNMQVLRTNITRLRLADGSFIPPESAEELKTPIIPYEDGKRIVNRGILSAMAEYCSLDWENRSFSPFMQQERSKGKWSDKQMAFIGGLHGMTQGGAHKSFQSKGACDEAFRKKAAAMLDSLGK